MSLGPATNHKWSGSGTVSTLIWSSDEAPAEMWTNEDFGERIIPTRPPENGCRFCVIDFPAGAPGRMHRTDTVDYVVCMGGEIDMDMDGEHSVHMKAGDVMVQQGTNHAWTNRYSETCRIAFVLIDGKPSADASLAGPGPVATVTAAPPAPTPEGITITPPSPEIRRIVTTHDPGGTALVMNDGPPPGFRGSGRGNVSSLIWSTDETPAEIWTAEDFGARTLGTQPPPLGSRFCIIDYPPGTPGRMHRTETADFIVCMAGGIDMEMDDGLIVHLYPGDVMVQQGTNHSWINNGTETCRLAIALLDAKPLDSKPKG
jgi:quercetin dioxygenase-like cupin family protein